VTGAPDGCVTPLVGLCFAACSLRRLLYVQQLRDVEQRLSNAYKLIEELNEKLRHSGESSGRGSIAQLLQVKRLHIVMAANT